MDVDLFLLSYSQGNHCILANRNARDRMDAKGQVG